VHRASGASYQRVTRTAGGSKSSRNAMLYRDRARELPTLNARLQSITIKSGVILCFDGEHQGPSDDTGAVTEQIRIHSGHKGFLD